MEQSEPYFRERAQAERAIAEGASSPQAKLAHLELAVRYVKAAEALYVSSHGSMDLSGPSSPDQQTQPAMTPKDLAPALGSAFPLPASGAFSDLLSVIG